MANQCSSVCNKGVPEELYNFTSSRTSTLSLDQTRSHGSSCSLWKYVSPRALNHIFPLSASGFLLWDGLLFDYFSTAHPRIPKSIGIKCKTEMAFDFLSMSGRGGLIRNTLPWALRTNISWQIVASNLTFSLLILYSEILLIWVAILWNQDFRVEDRQCLS